MLLAIIWLTQLRQIVALWRQFTTSEWVICSIMWGHYVNALFPNISSQYGKDPDSFKLLPWNLWHVAFLILQFQVCCCHSATLPREEVFFIYFYFLNFSLSLTPSPLVSLWTIIHGPFNSVPVSFLHVSINLGAFPCVFTWKDVLSVNLNFPYPRPRLSSFPKAAYLFFVGNGIWKPRPRCFVCLLILLILALFSGQS